MSYNGENGNSSLMKKLNSDKILKSVFFNRPISRAKISRLTGLNKVTVSNCIEPFLNAGILKEIGIDPSSKTRGRPATFIDVNQDAGICVGIEVSTHNFTVLVVDLGFHFLESTKHRLPEDPDEFVNLICKLLGNLKEQYKEHLMGIIGVGIALPGLYNAKTGEIEYTAHLQSWIHFPLRGSLANLELPFPIFIDSSGRAGAMGEVYFGQSHLNDYLAYIGGSWGLGVGFFSQGQILSGASGYAGRLGHSTIHFNGKKCICGNKGCWEMYASAKALFQSLYTMESPDEDKLVQVLERIRNHDSEVMLAVQRIGYYLALGIVNIINAYNPSSVCIGGYLAEFGPLLSNAVTSTLAEMLPESFLKHLRVYCSELGDLGVAYGAISMVKSNLTNIFTPEKYAL